jgi:Fe-S oxidoreductase
MRRYEFAKVLTHCPHCFNTLANEYPQFAGGRFEVVHHSVLIDELIRAGRIAPQIAKAETVAFHDPCYLGRQNGTFDPPRAVAGAVPGVKLVEIPRNHARAVCCGGGGGQMWMDVHARKRINIVRAEEIAATGAATVAVGCPYCLTMLDEGRKVAGVEDRLQVKDIAELVAESLG